MTNYEKIKSLSFEGMVLLLSDLSPTVDPFASIYCERICPEKVDGRCPYDDDEKPCSTMSHQDDVEAWLKSDVEVEEGDK